MNLFDTTLPQMYSRGLYEEKCSDLAPEHTDKIFDCLFTGTTNLLNRCKSIDIPTAFVFKTIEGKFIAAGIVQYFANKDNNNIGNWSYVWTFEETDIPSNAVRMDINDPMSHVFYKATAGEKYSMKFEGVAEMIECFNYALTSLRKWLDENAKEGAEVSVELPGIFQSRVVVENGIKEFALEMDSEIKVLIKDDSAIEKK